MHDFFRVSDPHPFHADPDPGFEKIAYPDSQPGLYFFQKFVFFM